MAFGNPPVPWRELERTLSGRPGGDGGDSPAWSQKRDAYRAPEHASRPAHPVPYAELHAHSSFSFLDGASTPEELAEEAVGLGLEALALTDHDGFYGVVRFAEAAEALGLSTIFGAELGLDVPMPSTQAERAIGARVGIPDPAGSHLLVLTRDPAGYANLARTLSEAHLRGGVKGRPVYDVEQVAAAADGRWLILTGCRKGSVRSALTRGGYGTIDLDAGRRALDELTGLFGRENVAVEITHSLDPTSDELTDALALLAEKRRLPLVASTAAHYAGPRQRPLATTVAAVRARSTLAEVDGWLPAWAGQHLRSGAEMAERFDRYPQAIPAAAALGRELAFPLRLIAPQLPPFPVPAGHTEMSWLRELSVRGARERYGTPEVAAAWAKEHDYVDPYAQIDHELAIIEQLNFPGYFLVVWEIVEFCRKRGILCQGRGSAANSAVCYAIGITAVDAVRYGLLFERFLSPQREGAPDIDLDIESDRREEAIQHVYSRYGRRYTAQVANVISYRPKSAIRDVAKSLGYSMGQQDAWSKTIEQGYYWAPAMKLRAETKPEGASQQDGHEPDADRTSQRAERGADRRRESTSDQDDRTVAAAAQTAQVDPGDVSIPADVLSLAEQLQKAPRHLGIHSGGMVICDRPIIEVCPVEWGRMANRSVLQWDKDDCAGAGLVKFDLLGLGMLSALTYCFDFVEQWHGKRYGLHQIPAEDPLVYDMLCKADTVGVFQVESRAQMATLPRLKPREFYDLVVEIALIRPGPIQGESVHPYIRRRSGKEPITYPHPKLEKALKKTKGIPLFQEQLMQLAIDAAGCTAAEADQLRKAMGSKRSEEKMEAMRERLYAGMAANDITGAVADDIYTKIRAFAAFGFAESHAISFAFLVYASSWLKLYHPAAFTAALLNAQPMGFYSPQSLVQDAKRHGVIVRGPDVNLSTAGASLEDRARLWRDAAVSAADPPQAVAYSGPGPAQPAIRMGLSSVRMIGTEQAEAIETARVAGGSFTSMTDLVRRTGIGTEQVEALATGGAFDSLDLTRRGALWAAAPVAAIRPEHLPLATVDERASPPLPEMTEPEQLIADYWATSVTLDDYPTALIRDRLDALGVLTAMQLRQTADRTRVLVGGVVTHRQRPNTAQGIIFINLEDETGMVNIVCHPTVWNRNRRVARESGGLLVRGMLERVDGVTNVIAEKIEKLHLGIRAGSRDFR
ncbi:MAG: error-prone DNA polymerase [Jatrophihabitans sp.]